LNGDGILDLATTDDTPITSTEVSVLLGNGDGTFQGPTSFAAGTADFGLVGADMNADGKIDLVVGNYTGFSVWLGNGDGTFSLGTAVPVTGAAEEFTSVAAAAFKAGAPPGIAVGTLNNVFLFLQGTSPVLSLSAAALTFAPQAPGTSSFAQAITLTNSGTATLAVSGIGISGTDASGFAETNNCTSLAANASCLINVTSTPNAAGAQAASLSVTDNAPGSPQTVALNGTGSDFSLSVTTQASITVTPGQAANYSISVNPTVGFTQMVSLSCSGEPAQSTCTVTPSSTTLNGSATVNVAVVTTGATAGMTQPAGGPSANNPFGLWAVFSGTLGLTLLTGMTRFRREGRPQARFGLTLLCLLFFGMGMSACGGGSSGSLGGSGGTPAGTYGLTVTGTYTSGSITLTHNTKLILVVQ
jgi:hypothetical protein